MLEKFQNRLAEWLWENYFIVYYVIYTFRREFLDGGTFSEAIIPILILIPIYVLTFKRIGNERYQKIEVSEWLNYFKASKLELLRPILTSIGFFLIAIPIGFLTDTIILFFASYFTFELAELRKLLRLKIEYSD